MSSGSSSAQRGEEAMDSKDKTATIAKLNDAFRQSFAGGQVMLAAGVNALDGKSKTKLLNEVRSFATFSKDNDPHKEHDFGKVEIEGQNYFWKIDYYNLTLDGGSEDPTNPAVTTRVLTIMRTDEY
jgi:Protein of unknown function (DUF3768)